MHLVVTRDHRLTQFLQQQRDHQPLSEPVLGVTGLGDLRANGVCVSSPVPDMPDSSLKCCPAHTLIGGVSESLFSKSPLIIPNVDKATLLPIPKDSEILYRY